MVRSILGLAVGTTFIASSASAGTLAFTAGNLLVQRVGDGTAPLSSAATNVALQEFQTTGSAVRTINLPSSGGSQVTDSGSATSNGYLNVFNGYVAVSGYNSAAGTASVTGLNTKVGTVFNGDSTVASRTLFPTGGPTGTPPSPFSGNNFRSMIATGANTFYATGTASGTPNTGGAWYYDGSNFTQVSSTAAGQPTNLRNVEIYGGQLYASSAATTGYGIWSIGTGLPTAGGQTSTLVINSSLVGTGTGSSYGFVMFDTYNDNVLDLAYVADDRTTAGGGIQKWVLSGGTWSNSWALLVNGSGALQAAAGTGFAGLRGLTGTWDAVNGAQLYATTTEISNNRLVSILDNGTTPTLATNLASEGANYAFRGVDIYVIPAPGALALLGVAGLAAGRRRRA
ncbi:MAG: hypothetical protein ACKOV8_03655 [Phycisphaerales bacterium]